MFRSKKLEFRVVFIRYKRKHSYCETKSFGRAIGLQTDETNFIRLMEELKHQLINRANEIVWYPKQWYRLCRNNRG